MLRTECNMPWAASETRKAPKHQSPQPFKLAEHAVLREPVSDPGERTFPGIRVFFKEFGPLGAPSASFCAGKDPDFPSRLVGVLLQFPNVSNREYQGI